MGCRKQGAVREFQSALAEAVTFTKSNEAATCESIARYTKLPPAVVAALPIPNLVAKISPDDLKFFASRPSVTIPRALYEYRAARPGVVGPASRLSRRFADAPSAAQTSGLAAGERP